MYLIGITKHNITLTIYFDIVYTQVSNIECSIPCSNNIPSNMRNYTSISTNILSIIPNNISSNNTK